MKNSLYSHKMNDDRFKFILQDAVRRGDLDLVRDNWEHANRLGSSLLLVAVEEGCSSAMIEYLLENVEVRNDDISVLQRWYSTAIENDIAAVFQKHDLRKLAASSHDGEKLMIDTLKRVAATRSTELISTVWKQVPPALETIFLRGILPDEPDDQAEEALAMECLVEIYNAAESSHCLRVTLLGSLTALCRKRYNSISMAMFILESLESSLKAEETYSHPSWYAVIWDHIRILSLRDTLESARLTRFLMEYEYPDPEWTSLHRRHHMRDISYRPGPSNIHIWLGETWDQLIDRIYPVNAQQQPDSPSTENTLWDDDIDEHHEQRNVEDVHNVSTSQLPPTLRGTTDLDIQTYIIQTLQTEEGAWSRGWQSSEEEEKITRPERATQVQLLIDALRSLGPPVEISRAIEVSLNYERKVFAEQAAREDYDREIADKLNKIRDQRAWQLRNSHLQQQYQHQHQHHQQQQQHHQQQQQQIHHHHH